MFNDPIAVKRFEALHQKFKFSHFVETGTWLGVSSLAASKYCPVVTMEINPQHRSDAAHGWTQAGFEEQDGIFLHSDGRQISSLLGNSPELLAGFLRGGDYDWLCFFLDSHWLSYWPIIDELKVIAAANVGRESVILIHDFRVPGKNWGFDSYGGQDLDLSYVKPWLDKINPDYDISFNEDVAGSARGILYATPK